MILVERGRKAEKRTLASYERNRHSLIREPKTRYQYHAHYGQRYCQEQHTFDKAGLSVAKHLQSQCDSLGFARNKERERTQSAKEGTGNADLLGAGSSQRDSDCQEGEGHCKDRCEQPARLSDTLVHLFLRGKPSSQKPQNRLRSGRRFTPDQCHMPLGLWSRSQCD